MPCAAAGRVARARLCEPDRVLSASARGHPTREGSDRLREGGARLLVLAGAHRSDAQLKQPLVLLLRRLGIQHERTSNVGIKLRSHHAHLFPVAPADAVVAALRNKPLRLQLLEHVAGRGLQLLELLLDLVGIIIVGALHPQGCSRKR